MIRKVIKFHVIKDFSNSWQSGKVVVHGQGAGFAHSGQGAGFVHSVAVGVDELKQVVDLSFTVDTEIVLQ